MYYVYGKYVDVDKIQIELPGTYTFDLYANQSYTFNAIAGGGGGVQFIFNGGVFYTNGGAGAYTSMSFVPVIDLSLRLVQGSGGAPSPGGSYVNPGGNTEMVFTNTSTGATVLTVFLSGGQGGYYTINYGKPGYPGESATVTIQNRSAFSSITYTTRYYKDKDDNNWPSGTDYRYSYFTNSLTGLGAGGTGQFSTVSGSICAGGNGACLISGPLRSTKTLKASIVLRSGIYYDVYR